MSLIIAATAPAQNGMTPKVYEEVSAINKLMVENRNEDAATRLNALLDTGNLSEYEQAVSQQLLGYAHLGSNKTKPAITAFESALALGALPDDVTLTVTTALAQACLDIRDFACARRHIDAILAQEASPTPDFLAVAAYIYFELREFSRAEELALKAIASSDKPQENTYQILLSVYREQNAYTKAESLLRDILARYPENTSYWQYLSYVLFEQDKNHEALASLMLAYRLGLLKGDDLECIVGLHANLGIPEKAARLLGEWLASGTLEPTTERIFLEGRLWIRARETETAKQVLTRAAESAPNGQIALLLGKLHYQNDEWNEAEQYLSRALDKGSLDNETSEARYLLGISAYQNGNRDVAAAALKAASNDSRFSDSARYWLGQLPSPD
ncbi:MAG: tetratricopeptide repeat protein [Gammaproteobacteria bacterium]|nr:tetratricopeptide repeat protein [Gammaproteobacteria bacterium]